MTVSIFANGSPGVKRLQRKFEKLAGNLRNRRKLMKQIGIRLMIEADKNFIDQGREGKPWTKLSPATIAGRRTGKGKGPPKILLDTRRLNASITKTENKDNVFAVSNTMVKIGTNVGYAPKQHFGDPGPPKNPARPFLPSKKKALGVAIDATEKEIKRQKKNTGFR